MPGATAHGATFSFGAFSGVVTGLSFDSPVAEIVDMTSGSHRSPVIMAVPTGAWTGGVITVEYMGGAFQGLVGTVGQLTFSSSGLSLSRRVVCESASSSAQIGDAVRGTIRFRLTDYMGN